MCTPCWEFFLLVPVWWSIQTPEPFYSDNWLLSMKDTSVELNIGMSTASPHLSNCIREFRQEPKWAIMAIS